MDAHYWSYGTRRLTIVDGITVTHMELCGDDHDGSLQFQLVDFLARAVPVA